jgi:MFS family permease
MGHSASPNELPSNAEPGDGVAPQQALGTARDALSVPAFRRVLLASFVSNSGRWMQQVILGVFAWEMTESPQFLGLVIFAQLGPMLLLALIGGSLADSVDRKKLLIATQAWQAAWGLLLAQQVADGEISRSTLLILVAIIGVGQALYAPTFTAIVPSLVGRENLSAAISLNSAQVNGSRVVGPALGGWLVAVLGVSAVFVINALTYLFVIAALLSVTIPAVAASSRSSRQKILDGFRIARRAPQIGRPLVSMAAFAFFCLPFVGQMPTLAELNLGVDAQSQTFGWLYATFGLGALAGAASVGTVLLDVSKRQVVRVALVSFGFALAALASVSSAYLAFPIMFLVGTFYFMVPTALSTILQAHLEDQVRGRVMALWVLSFGGVVPLSNLVSGFVVERTSVSLVIYGGAISAWLIAANSRLVTGPVVGEELLD